MVSGQQRVMVDTLLVSGHEDQCDVTVTLDAYWLVRSEVGSGIRGESTVKVTGEVMVSGQQRVMVDTLLVSGHEDQCGVTVTLDAYWLVRSEGGNEGREGDIMKD
ncbi:hypothetical protein Pcinc_005926 [Petrolisthes cinctipes]|uniref:Uncharacterized protein n=1 Tax=Petrolisthes cinctipes TaxID=88211 RepID=A0AAE1GDZ5_PETCI|nr:hypothetical protein Pcinc_005926 [Petrolisthes cinctipes]